MDKARIAPLVAAIEAQGWSVWWDPEISAGPMFDDQIESELSAASCVLVVWTPASVASRRTRGEAREAAETINRAMVDPDLNPVRGDARFTAMIAKADARLAAKS